MRLLSIWDVANCPKVNKSNYSLFRDRKMSDYMYSIYFTLQSHGGSLLSLRQRKSSELVQAVLRQKPLCFRLCTIMRVFPSDPVGSPTALSSIRHFLSRTDGKRCKSLISPKSIPLVFCLLLLLSHWQFSLSVIAEWMSEWKYWTWCFRMCCKISPIKVCSVNLLH